MKTKKKFCSCGKTVIIGELCPCKEGTNRNRYQREYYKKNKEILAPLSSVRWRKLRSLIIKRDNSCCHRCFVKFNLINSVELQVHHIKPRTIHPELMFEESNLLTLCKTCNLQIGLKELDFKPTIDLNNTELEFNL